jgi:hypothetical protein
MSQEYRIFSSDEEHEQAGGCRNVYVKKRAILRANEFVK